MSFPKLFHLLTHTQHAVIVWDTDFNHWDRSLMLDCLHDASLTSINLPLASGFQIKYRKDWNDTKSKYTLTETPLLHTAQEAARILDQVWVLPRCLGLWVGTIGDVCTRLLPPFWLFSVTLCGGPLSSSTSTRKAGRSKKPQATFCLRMLCRLFMPIILVMFRAR